jgi:hypothetical protein
MAAICSHFFVHKSMKIDFSRNYFEFKIGLQDTNFKWVYFLAIGRHITIGIFSELVWSINGYQKLSMIVTMRSYWVELEIRDRSPLIVVTPTRPL